MAAEADQQWTDSTWEQDVGSAVGRAGTWSDKSWYDGVKRSADAHLRLARTEWQRAALLMSHEERSERGVVAVSEPSFLSAEAKVKGLDNAWEREVAYLTAIHVRLGGLIDRNEDDDIMYPFQVQERLKKQKVVTIWIIKILGLLLVALLS